ncbi:MAG: response regulator [Ignavibacteriales bacterium]|nr:MAG: response regulator [Ignavibacteriales bacterium]
MADDSQGMKPKILITEDDYENQKFLEMFLGRKFDVEICDSEQSFYAQLERNKFDIILMDISLKGNKNGLELTRELRKRKEYEKIPVICLTAHAFKRDMDNALEAGVDIFLTKPVENQILLKTLLDALESGKSD